MSDRRIIGLIDSLYAAAAGEESWGSVAPRFAEAFLAQSCALQLRGRNGEDVTRLSQTANYTPQLNKSYMERFYRLDPWVKGGLRIPGLVRTGDEVISDSDLLGTEFYTEYLRPAGIFYMMGAVVPLGEPGSSGILGIHRAREAGLFSNGQKSQLAIVIPHLRRALQMRSVLDAATIRKTIAEDALDALGVGMLLVRPDCRIVFANRTAESMMAEEGPISCRNGRLRLTADKRPDFEQIVRASAMHYCGSATSREDPLSDSSERSRGHDGANSEALLMRDASGRGVSLLICPVDADRMGFRPSGPLAVVFVDVPGRKSSPGRALARLYGLTPAELRLMTALLNGERANDYADRAGISRNTVKTQLAQVFAKMGVSRQSDLMRMISGQSIVAILEH